MSKCTAYYTTADEDNDKCYHNDDNCLTGKQIKVENKAFGTGNRKLCKNCENMK